MGMGAGVNGNNQWEWEGNGNKTRLNLGLGMGINHWEWEGMGLKKIFPLISKCDRTHYHCMNGFGRICVSLCLFVMLLTSNKLDLESSF